MKVLKLIIIAIITIFTISIIVTTINEDSDDNGNFPQRINDDILNILLDSKKNIEFDEIKNNYIYNEKNKKYKKVKLVFFNYSVDFRHYSKLIPKTNLDYFTNPNLFINKTKLKSIKISLLEYKDIISEINTLHIANISKVDSELFELYKAKELTEDEYKYLKSRYLVLFNYQSLLFKQGLGLVGIIQKILNLLEKEDYEVKNNRFIFYSDYGFDTFNSLTKEYNSLSREFQKEIKNNPFKK